MICSFADKTQKGAALLAAMLVVTTVATLAATAVAWQTKHVEIQIAERSRAQALWLLRGAMDWSRLLLRQDAQSKDGVDHLAEPWAVPLQETKITSFISADNGVQQADASADMSEAFLAGQMQDLQSKINLAQLKAVDVQSKESNPVQRLFALLGLPQREYQLLLQAIAMTQKPEADPQRLLEPRSIDDLQWYGLSASSLHTLRSHAYWHEGESKVNLNTASALVIQAASEGISAAQAIALVNARRQQHFANLLDAQKVLEGMSLSSEVFTVGSGNFQAQGWVRMDGIALSLTAQLSRNGSTVTAADVSLQGVPFQP